MNKLSKQSGFSIINTLAIIIFVLLIFFIGWNLWNVNHKQNSSSEPVASNEENHNTTQVNEQDVNSGYVVIDSWNVKLKPVDGLIGLKTVNRPSGIANAEEEMFITDAMQKLQDACNGKSEGTRPLGALVRTKEEISNLGNLQFISQINGYNFYYYAPASSCSSNTDNETLQAKTLDQVKATLTTLKKN